MQIDRIQKSYGSHIVLNGLSLALPDRGFCCITGPSGSGKTTLLRILAGLEQPDSGTVTGRPSRISMVFQEDRLFGQASALENVAVVSDRETAAGFLQELGLADSADKPVSMLSGGMRRRVAVARALAVSADVYLMDEPFSGLDTAARDETFSVIRRHTQQSLLVLVTHDLSVTAGADRILTLP